MIQAGKRNDKLPTIIEQKMTELTKKQQDMLEKFKRGAEPFATDDGYFWMDEPYLRCDMRTLNALIRKGVLIIEGMSIGSGGLLGANITLAEEWRPSNW